MQIKTVAALALLFLAQPAQAETPVLERCNTLFGSSFDCACATKFLQARVDDDDLEILLPLWAYSLDGSGKHSAEFDSFVHLVPGAASRKRATSSGLKTTGTLRGSCMNDRCLTRSGRSSVTLGNIATHQSDVRTQEKSRSAS